MRALAHVVEQAARTGHDDIDAAAQLRDLRLRAHAAIDGDAAQPGLAAQRADGRMGLLGQFARGGQDERAHVAARAGQQPLQQRQHEGGGLAGAGLGQAHHVAPLRDQRDRLLLDRRRHAVAQGLDPCRDARIKIKCLEIHDCSLSTGGAPRHTARHAKKPGGKPGSNRRHIALGQSLLSTVIVYPLWPRTSSRPAAHCAAATARLRLGPARGPDGGIVPPADGPKSLAPQGQGV